MISETPPALAPGSVAVLVAQAHYLADFLGIGRAQHHIGRKIQVLGVVAAVVGVSDLFAVVAILLLGTVALTLAGLDTGTAFGGMGASREVTIVALVEPTILLAIFALSVRVGSSDLTDIVAGTIASPSHLLSPASLLAAVAFAVVIIAETGRAPARCRRSRCQGRPGGGGARRL